MLLVDNTKMLFDIVIVPMVIDSKSDDNWRVFIWK